MYMTDTNEIIEITYSNKVIDISGGTEFKKTVQQLKQEEFIKQRDIKITLIKKESVNMICRQTVLSQDEAKTELEAVNYDYMKVLNKYFGINEPEKKAANTVNQQIYGEIRNLMDAGSKSFRLERERTEQIQQIREQQKKNYEKMMNNKSDIKLNKIEEDDS